MAIVFNPVVKPTSWTGQALVNGKLTPCDLQAVWFPGVGHLSLHTYAARAWNAMSAVCLGDTGLHLSATGAYRSYDQQEQVFRQRYTLSYDPNVNVSWGSRTWNGRTWYLRKNCAPAAVPGTSNHGLGIAVDTGWWTGIDAAGLADIKQISTVRKGWDWLIDHAPEFGWSWEGAKPGQPGWEPWHLRHVEGNDVTQRVKDVEAFLGVKV